MLRDVFYFREKPNVHPRERTANDLADARRQCTTEHFWIINEFGNYRDFDWDWDFEFLPDEDVWAEISEFHMYKTGTTYNGFRALMVSLGYTERFKDNWDALYVLNSVVVTDYE